MNEVFFYHLTSQSVEQALPLLLEKTLERSLKAFVLCGSEEKMNKLDAYLWTYKEESFLAHTLVSDAHASDISILLGLECDNKNKAEFLFLTDSLPFPETQFQRICVLFSGNNEDELQNARAQWKEAKEKGASVSYFQQDDDGRWAKKA